MSKLADWIRRLASGRVDADAGAIPELAAKGPVLVLTLVAACAPAGAGATQGQTLTATPQSLASVLASARDGDVVVLAKGLYQNVRLSHRKYARPVTIDATAATIQGFLVQDVDGLEIRGGAFGVPRLPDPKEGKSPFGHALRLVDVKNIKILRVSVSGPGGLEGAQDGPFGAGWGVTIRRAENVEVRDSRFQGLRAGLSLGSVSHFHIAGNSFHAQSSDGIDVGEAWNGVIEGNTCSGTRMSVGSHPDCIQLWSRPNSPPTADVVIRRNQAQGPTQGIFMGNHTRNGVNDGGFDRITIEDNELNVAFGNAIALKEARDSVVRNNRVRTFPGSKYWATIRYTGEVKLCGNVIEAYLGKRGMKDPPCEKRPG